MSHMNRAMFPHSPRFLPDVRALAHCHRPPLLLPRCVFARDDRTLTLSLTSRSRRAMHWHEGHGKSVLQGICIRQPALLPGRAEHDLGPGAVTFWSNVLREAFASAVTSSRESFGALNVTRDVLEGMRWSSALAVDRMMEEAHVHMDVRAQTTQVVIKAPPGASNSLTPPRSALRTTNAHEGTMPPPLSLGAAHSARRVTWPDRSSMLVEAQCDYGRVLETVRLYQKDPPSLSRRVTNSTRILLVAVWIVALGTAGTFYCWNAEKDKP